MLLGSWPSCGRLGQHAKSAEQTCELKSRQYTRPARVLFLPERYSESVMTKKTKIVEKAPVAGVEAEKWLQMYRRMLAIRLFEEQVNDLYTRTLMPGLAHLYIGEEAVAVGVCSALRPDDYITSTHRGHGHCLAKGASPDRMFAELLGKEPGYCRGKGGSMHIADPETGNLGANAIVAGSTGIATGAAFSAKQLRNGRVAVCFFR